jgi:MraZ protein
MAFRGTFDYTLDAKNRLTIPAKFRTALAEGAVLARATERCFSIWPVKDFEAYVQTALAGLHPLAPQRDKILRYFSSNSFDTALDGAGRVMVPAPLLEHAGLQKDVVVTGVEDRLEVWDRARWTDYNAALDISDLTAAFGHPA